MSTEDKVRVYEIAEESGASSNEVITKAAELGLELKSVQSAVSYSDAEEITSYIMTGKSKLLKPTPKPKAKIVAKQTEEVESTEVIEEIIIEDKKVEEVVPKNEELKEEVKVEKKIKKVINKGITKVKPKVVTEEKTEVKAEKEVEIKVVEAVEPKDEVKVEVEVPHIIEKEVVVEKIVEKPIVEKEFVVIPADVDLNKLNEITGNKKTPITLEKLLKGMQHNKKDFTLNTKVKDDKYTAA